MGPNTFGGGAFNSAGGVGMGGGAGTNPLMQLLMQALGGNLTQAPGSAGGPMQAPGYALPQGGLMQGFMNAAPMNPGAALDPTQLQQAAQQFQQLHQQALSGGYNMANWNPNAAAQQALGLGGGWSIGQTDPRALQLLQHFGLGTGWDSAQQSPVLSLGQPGGAMATTDPSRGGGQMGMPQFPTGGLKIPPQLAAGGSNPAQQMLTQNSPEQKAETAMMDPRKLMIGGMF